MTARLAIHGGSGPIDRATFGANRERQYAAALHEVASEAWRLLLDGAEAVDVAQTAVRLLEESELFNAGRGAVLNSAGEVELDAALMDGRDRRCGAVAAIRTTRNPVALARAVMDQGDHVMLAGPAADAFGARQGLEQVAPDWFIVDERRRQLASAAEAGEVSLDHDSRYGTVGAVVRDQRANLAAATSTGGMTNQHPGRVGDSPLIGAGTWADNATCAVSGTGHGELFIRAMVGYDIHSRIAYAGESLGSAAAAALARASEMGGSGGLIAVDRQGRLALPFTATAMHRAWVDESGQVRVATF